MQLEMRRVWAMPSADTFDVQPIADFVQKYLVRSRVSIEALILMGTEPQDIDDVSDDLIDAIKHGFTVERCTVADARKTPFGCEDCRG